MAAFAAHIVVNLMEAQSQLPEVLSEAEVLKLLATNLGFDRPREWVRYALAHNFRPTRATLVGTCPDCGAAPSNTVGQYVYYSTLMHLRECGLCGLIWTDAHLDPDVIRKHFERTYKDEEYFAERRKPVFAHLAKLISEAAPSGGRVLDIGGAVGHLLQCVADRRPDLQLTLSDVSLEACSRASARLAVSTIVGGVEALECAKESYDVVVMSDVLYYEPRIRDFWRVLPGLVRAGGTALLRVPNKLHWIRWAQKFRRVTSGSEVLALQDRVSFFNPEHIYILSRPYLEERLRSVGFRHVATVPTRPLSLPGRDVLLRSLGMAARLLHSVSLGRFVATPSMIVMASDCSR